MTSPTRRQFLAAAAAGPALAALGGGSAPAAVAPPPADLPVSPARHEMSRLLAQCGPPRLIKVREGVHVAVGYALANVVLVETEAGTVVLDATESLQAAGRIAAEYAQVSTRPVKAIIYTHNHTDHVRGTKAFYREGIPVLAHRLFPVEARLQESRGLGGRQRALAMYGLSLPTGERAPFLTAWPTPTSGFLTVEPLPAQDLIAPTQLLEDRHSFHLGGVTFNVFNAPGETPDQLMVHLPELDALCCADNYYASFPNLYTIRGTSPRPVPDWASALEMARALKVEHLIPHHGYPVQGRELVAEVLANYRAAILHVYQRTMEGLAQNRPVEEIITQAALPPHLAGLPYLQELYGSVAYSVRGIYQGLMGWFDGEPVNLDPLPRRALAAEVLALAGSAEKVLAQAETALRAGRLQAALELTELVLAADPAARAARRLKAAALLALSRGSGNTPTINYYLTHALREKTRAESGGAG